MSKELIHKKTIYYSVIILELFFSAGLTFAQITNPIGYDDFGRLFEDMAIKIGGLIAGLGTVMLIVAGALYATSAGSQQRMAQAKTALIYAIAGIAIGLGAAVIVATVKSIMNAT